MLQIKNYTLVTVSLAFDMKVYRNKINISIYLDILIINNNISTVVYEILSKEYEGVRIVHRLFI